MDVQKIYQIFLYNTMSHKTIGGVYMVMNGIYLVIASACILILAYRFYGAFIAAKVLTLDQYRPTPAMVHNDGHDYVPTNKWVTFGHHFAAIAGAGPPRRSCYCDPVRVFAWCLMDPNRFCIGWCCT